MVETISSSDKYNLGLKVLNGWFVSSLVMLHICYVKMVMLAIRLNLCIHSNF